MTEPGAASALTGWVREALRCPQCHGELADGQAPGGGSELVCAACRRGYPVRDSIPVLLIDDARELTD